MRKCPKWGTLRGRIVWAGKQLPRQLPLAINPANLALAKVNQVLDETWIVDEKTKGLKDTFVWLAPAKKDAKLLIHPALRKIPDGNRKMEITMVADMYTPHALAMREGQILVFRNSSAVVHCVKWAGHPDRNPGGAVIIPAGKSHEAKNLNADHLPILVDCFIHPWMRAFVRVFDHPYFAVTDQHGDFEIKNAPAGPCRVMIWHGSGGWLSGVKGRNGRPITITGGKRTDLGEFPYTPPAP